MQLLIHEWGLLCYLQLVTSIWDKTAILVENWLPLFDYCLLYVNIIMLEAIFLTTRLCFGRIQMYYIDNSSKKSNSSHAENLAAYTRFMKACKHKDITNNHSRTVLKLHSNYPKGNKRRFSIFYGENEKQTYTSWILLAKSRKPAISTTSVVPLLSPPSNLGYILIIARTQRPSLGLTPVLRHQIELISSPVN